MERKNVSLGSDRIRRPATNIELFPESLFYIYTYFHSIPPTTDEASLAKMKFSSSVLCGLVLAASTADISAFVPSSGKAAAPSSSSTFQILSSSTVTETASINGATNDDDDAAAADTTATATPAVPEASTSLEEEKEAPKVETVADIKKDEPEPVVKKEEVATPAAVPAAAAAAAVAAPVAAAPASEPENTDRIEP